MAKYYKPKFDANAETTRAKTPRGNEMFGVVESKLGFGRTNVICMDKKIRICAVPGKFKRKIWLNIGDIVIVEPWEYEGDRKGYVTYKYRKGQINWLRNNGHLEGLDV